MKHAPRTQTVELDGHTFTAYLANDVALPAKKAAARTKAQAADASERKAAQHEGKTLRTDLQLHIR